MTKALATKDKVSAIFCLVVVFLALLAPPPVAAAQSEGHQPSDSHETQAVAAGPKVKAPLAILVDRTSSPRVLWEKNADERAYIASTTKMMTALLILKAKRGQLEEVITVSQKAAEVGGAGLDLEVGEQIKVEDLLYGLLLRSANDAAVTLAEAVAGSEEVFVERMNRRAKELGAQDTRFFNPHGLDGNYSTPRDLAKIALVALESPTFRRMVKEESRTIPWPGNPYPRVAENHNKLLDVYEYATGVKTGYTREAGNCLVASATKEGRELVSVVLGEASAVFAYEDTVALLEHGFNDFTTENAVKRGQAYRTVAVPFWKEKELVLAAERDLQLVVNRAEDLQKEIVVSEEIDLPIAEGARLGEIRIKKGGEVLGKVPLVAADRVPAPSIWDRFKAFLGNLFG